jgi:hypothetical protein
MIASFQFIAYKFKQKKLPILKTRSIDDILIFTDQKIRKV